MWKHLLTLVSTSLLIEQGHEVVVIKSKCIYIYIKYKYIMCITHHAGEGDCVLSVGAFYGWVEFIKYLIHNKGLNPKGIVYYWKLI